MWPHTFQLRLDAWADLRHQLQNQPAHTALAQINSWWFRCPWRPYHLHWDDLKQWPDPWQLLDDNVFCSLARGLGMLYTIAMIDRPDLQSAELVDTGMDNLVLVHQKKYILNWDRRQIVNINLTPFNSLHSVGQEQIKLQIR